MCGTGKGRGTGVSKGKISMTSTTIKCVRPVSTRSVRPALTHVGCAAAPLVLPLHTSPAPTHLPGWHLSPRAGKRKQQESECGPHPCHG